MKISKSSDNLIELIKHYEGCKLDAYPDPATGGIPITIGYGNTSYEDGKRIQIGDKISKDRVISLLKNKLIYYEKEVDNLTRDDINQSQFDALVDFAYNCGVTNLQNSTLLKLVNKNPDTQEKKLSIYNSIPTNMNIIQIEFLKWDKANGKSMKGLKSRRITEWILYSTNKLVLL